MGQLDSQFAGALEHGLSLGQSAAQHEAQLQQQYQLAMLHAALTQQSLNQRVNYQNQSLSIAAQRAQDTANYHGQMVGVRSDANDLGYARLGQAQNVAQQKQATTQQTAGENADYLTSRLDAPNLGAQYMGSQHGDQDWESMLSGTLGARDQYAQMTPAGQKPLLQDAEAMDKQRMVDEAKQSVSAAVVPNRLKAFYAWASTPSGAAALKANPGLEAQGVHQAMTGYKMSAPKNPPADNSDIAAANAERRDYLDAHTEYAIARQNLRDFDKDPKNKDYLSEPTKPKQRTKPGSTTFGLGGETEDDPEWKKYQDVQNQRTPLVSALDQADKARQEARKRTQQAAQAIGQRGQRRQPGAAPQAPGAPAPSAPSTIPAGQPNQQDMTPQHDSAAQRAWNELGPQADPRAVAQRAQQILSESQQNFGGNPMENERDDNEPDDDEDDTDAELEAVMAGAGV